MAKKYSTSWWNKRLDKLLMQAVRVRENMVCEHCKKKITSGGDAHTSHIIPKGGNPSIRFELLNVLLLCYRCHWHWWHKEILDAGKWYEENYPDSYKALMKMKVDRVGSKFTRLDYEMMEEYLKSKIEDYTKEIME